MSKLKFVWIDDEPARKPSADHLKEGTGMSGRFINTSDANHDDELKDLFKGDVPDIILIDHNLQDKGTGIFKKGSTLAVYIQETWPNCPIICITAQDIGSFDSQKKSLYVAIYSFNKLSNHYSSILTIAKSFKKMSENPPSDVKELLKLLKAPVSDYDRLTTIIPEGLKNHQNDESLSLAISHWVQNVLLTRPGFVYDRLWIATILGLTESAFAKVEDLFSKAKYTGIFADESRELWWKSKVLEILSATVKGVGLPWEKGRRLRSSFKAKDFSRCHSTKEEFPETVAFIDETKTAKRFAMKLHQTMPHSGYDDMLFFEQIRVMNPA